MAADDGAHSAPASLVRTVSSHEAQPDLFNEMKALTFESGREHALVRYGSGERAILSGGHTGITGLDDIEELIAHTHPYDIPGQGEPSIADYTALHQLGQERSILLEHGLEIPFGVDDPTYLKLFGSG